MTEIEKIPQAIATATVRIMGVDLTVHVLDNGQRVIDGDDLARFFDALGDSTEPFTEDDAVRLAKVIRGIA